MGPALYPVGCCQDEASGLVDEADCLMKCSLLSCPGLSWQRVLYANFRGNAAVYAAVFPFGVGNVPNAFAASVNVFCASGQQRVLSVCGFSFHL